MHYLDHWHRTGTDKHLHPSLSALYAYTTTKWYRYKRQKQPLDQIQILLPKEGQRTSYTIDQYTEDDTDHDEQQLQEKS